MSRVYAINDNVKCAACRYLGIRMPFLYQTLVGASKNLLRRHLLRLRASLCTSIAAFLGATFAPLTTVFRGPLVNFENPTKRASRAMTGFAVHQQSCASRRNISAARHSFSRPALVFTLALASQICLSNAQAESLNNAAPYVLEGTQVHKLPAKKLGRQYELYVSLPASYAESKRAFPVLFVTDANYAFPLIRAIAKRVGDGGNNLEDFILVGLSYATGDTPTVSRNRDYTPLKYKNKQQIARDKANQAIYGEAEGYRQYLANEVFPFLASQYRIDMQRKVFAGHSYGGIFGAHVLLTEPSMFSHYILGSPSLFYDHRSLFDKEEEYANKHKDLPAKVFLMIGGYERVNPASKNPRYLKEVDMVADMLAWQKQLQGRRYPNLEIRSKVLEDEDHLTVAPNIITRGLLWALPGKNVK